jgi:GxxExxY protein
MNHSTADDDTPRLRGTGAYFEVHGQLGSGLKSTYEEALCIELKDQEIPFIRQAPVPVFYKGHLIGSTAKCYEPESGVW